MMNKWTCEYAARGGQLAVWLVEQGCPIDVKATMRAARGKGQGKAAIRKWLKTLPA